MPPDAGARDSSIVDGSIVLDSGASDAADDSSAVDSSADAAPSDGGAPDAASSCGGRCNPVLGLCAAGVCLLSSSGPRCAETGGLGVEGARCSAVGDCGAGLSCFLTRAGGVCARVCCPLGRFEGASDCAMGELCAGTGALVDGTVTDYRRCVAPRPCDLFDAMASCDHGEGCYIVDGEGHTDCRVAGAAAVGEACAAPSDCAPGLACAGLVSPTCVRVCSLRPGAEPCPTGEGECVAQAQSPMGTGLCTVPAAAALR